MVKVGAFRADLYYRLERRAGQPAAAARAPGDIPLLGRDLPGSVLAADGFGGRSGFSREAMHQMDALRLARQRAANCGTSSNGWPSSTAARGSNSSTCRRKSARPRPRCPPPNCRTVGRSSSNLKRQIVEDLERRFLTGCLGSLLAKRHPCGRKRRHAAAQLPCPAAASRAQARHVSPQVTATALECGGPRGSPLLDPNLTVFGDRVGPPPCPAPKSSSDREPHRFH